MSVNNGPNLRQFLRIPGFGVIAILALIYIFMAVAVPERFFSANNQINILKQIVPVAVIAIGMTGVIIAGGIDLSVGAIVGVAGGVMAWMLTMNVPIAAAMIAAILVGAAIGFLNGWLISSFKISDFIVTLATLSVFRGILYVWTEGIPFRAYMTGSLEWLANGSLLFIPVPIAILIILAALFTLVLRTTSFGANLYAMGSNREAALLAGVQVDRVKILTYVLSGLLAGVAGIILAARLTTVHPEMGTGYELDVIGAVIIGGTSLFGGRGVVYGSILGAVLIGVIENATVLLGIDPLLQNVIVGIILLLAVGMDQLGRSASTRPIGISKRAPGSVRA